MATTTTTTPLHHHSSTFSAPKPSPTQPHFHSLPFSRRHLPRLITAVAGGGGTHLLGGDFGARDPFPGEVESNFGEKVLGHGSTEHKILIPSNSSLSLSQQQCSPVSRHDTPLSYDEAKQLLFKVLGWRLVEDKDNNDRAVLKLQCIWKLRDFSCGAELTARIAKVTEGTGHFPVLHLERNNQVRAELWTEEIGGLSLNDFIIAAKIDEVKTSDLVPRKRVWA